jgi:hypothetical protein
MIIWCFMSGFWQLQTLTYRHLLELPYKVLSSYARSIIFRALILQTGIWATSAAWDVTTIYQRPAWKCEAISCVWHGFIDYLNSVGW